MHRVSLALLGVVALAALSVLAQARQTDVSGAWELVIETPNGEMTSTVKFIQEGDKLTVSMTGPRGRETTGEGSIKGEEIQWSVVRDTERGQLTVVYKGAVQGGTMSGQAEIGGTRTAPWKAVKQ
jgi:hypothetical protein